MPLQPVRLNPHRKLSCDEPVLNPFYPEQMERHIRPRQQIVRKKRQGNTQNNAAEQDRRHTALLFPASFHPVPFGQYIQQNIQKRQKYQRPKQPLPLHMVCPQKPPAQNSQSTLPAEGYLHLHILSGTVQPEKIRGPALPRIKRCGIGLQYSVAGALRDNINGIGQIRRRFIVHNHPVGACFQRDFLTYIVNRASCFLRPGYRRYLQRIFLPLSGKLPYQKNK